MTVGVWRLWVFGCRDCGSRGFTIDCLVASDRVGIGVACGRWYRMQPLLHADDMVAHFDTLGFDILVVEASEAPMSVRFANDLGCFGGIKRGRRHEI